MIDEMMETLCKPTAAAKEVERMANIIREQRKKEEDNEH